MGQAFDLKTGRLAVGDPVMGLAQYPTALPPGAYRLGPRALRQLTEFLASAQQPRISLDSPCVFALDAVHVGEFEQWYHRVGNECSYMILTIAERLAEFETAVGVQVGFYWEHEVAGTNREGTYVLDPAQILNFAACTGTAAGGEL